MNLILAKRADFPSYILSERCDLGRIGQQNMNRRLRACNLKSVKWMLLKTRIEDLTEAAKSYETVKTGDESGERLQKYISSSKGPTSVKQTHS